MKNHEKNLCLRLPSHIVHLAQLKLKGKISKICQKAIETELNIDGELANVNQKIEETEKELTYLTKRREEIREEIAKRPPKLRRIL